MTHVHDVGVGMRRLLSPNPKSEIQNPKQVPNAVNRQKANEAGSPFAPFFFRVFSIVSDFNLQLSTFNLPRAAP